MRIVNIRNLCLRNISFLEYPPYHIQGKSPIVWIPVSVMRNTGEFSVRQILRINDLVFYVFGCDEFTRGFYGTIWKPPFAQMLALAVVFWDRLVTTYHLFIQLLGVWGLAECEWATIPTWRDIKIVRAIRWPTVHTLPHKKRSKQ